MLNSKIPKTRILVCGILPPPNFGHSMMYKMLMESSFIKDHEVIFLNLHFWTYGKHKRVTGDKLVKLIKYLGQFIYLIIVHRPQYVLFNMSFDKMPFLKDYLFCLVGFLGGCKIVLHDMGQYLPELYASSGSTFKWLITHMLKMTTAIIVMGEKVRKEYQPFISPEKLVVVPGCVEETIGLNVPVIPKTNPKEIRVLYFSFLSVSKGLWTALKAIPQVVAQNKNITFKFAGPIESEQLHVQMKDYIVAKKLEETVNYIGYVSTVEQRTECFRSADIFIFPTHRDVFGLVILHAMAESLPVVASLEGTIPEIIEDGVNGLLFAKGDDKQLADKILQLSQDVEMRKNMGAANRQRYLMHYAPQVYGNNMTKAFRYIQSLS